MYIYIIYICKYIYTIYNNIHIHITRNVLELTYDLKKLLTVTSISFFILIFILKNE